MRTLLAKWGGWWWLCDGMINFFSSSCLLLLPFCRDTHTHTPSVQNVVRRAVLIFFCFVFGAFVVVCLSLTPVSVGERRPLRCLKQGGAWCLVCVLGSWRRARCTNEP